MCHVSCVMCDVSCVMCHAEHIIMGLLHGEAMDVDGFDSLIRIILFWFNSFEAGRRLQKLKTSANCTVLYGIVLLFLSHWIGDGKGTWKIVLHFYISDSKLILYFMFKKWNGMKCSDLMWCINKDAADACDTHSKMKRSNQPGPWCRVPSLHATSTSIIQWQRRARSLQLHQIR